GVLIESMPGQLPSGRFIPLAQGAAVLDGPQAAGAKGDGQDIGVGAERLLAEDSTNRPGFRQRSPREGGGMGEDRGAHRRFPWNGCGAALWVPSRVPFAPPSNFTTVFRGVPKSQ